MPDSDIQLRPLGDLLADAHAGKIQVPEFQRTFALKDDWIVSLLASVSLGYPIGALTFLAAGASDLRFEFRAIAGSRPASNYPEWLVVDGQQRLTALYQALAAGPATTRPWYIDVASALEPTADRDRTIRVGAAARDSDAGLFPLHLVFGDSGELDRWQREFAELGGDRQLLVGRFQTEILRPLAEYRIPIIALDKKTSRWTVRVHGGPEGPALSDRFRHAAKPDT